MLTYKNVASAIKEFPQTDESKKIAVKATYKESESQQILDITVTVVVGGKEHVFSVWSGARKESFFKQDDKGCYMEDLHGNAPRRLYISNTDTVNDINEFLKAFVQEAMPEETKAAIERKRQEKLAAKAEADKMPTYLVLEDAHSYGHTLYRARFATNREKENYNPDWWQDHIMFPVGDDKIKLSKINWQDNPKRPADGAFGGCDNSVWIITKEEWDRYVALNAEREAEAQEKERQKEIARLQVTLAEGKAQSFLPTKAEAEQMRKEYNDLHNEGGEGFVPHYVTKEDYEKASERLRNLGVEPRPWRDDSSPANEIVLSDRYGWEVKFSENGWELMAEGSDRGYLHVDYDSPDRITDKLKETLMTYWAETPDGWPGLGGTPQSKYGLRCAEFNENRTEKSHMEKLRKKNKKLSKGKGGR